MATLVKAWIFLVMLTLTAMWTGAAQGRWPVLMQVGVILAVVIAWWIVSALFSILWFIAKLAIVAVVAVVVFLVLRGMFSSKAD